MCCFAGSIQRPLTSLFVFCQNRIYRLLAQLNKERSVEFDVDRDRPEIDREPLPEHVEWTSSSSVFTRFFFALLTRIFLLLSRLARLSSAWHARRLSQSRPADLADVVARCAVRSTSSIALAHALVTRNLQRQCSATADRRADGARPRLSAARRRSTTPRRRSSSRLAFVVVGATAAGRPGRRRVPRSARQRRRRARRQRRRRQRRR